MGFWDRSLLICKYLCDYGHQSVRHLAQQIGISKSSVHRLRQARERRSGFPEAALWETEAGHQWLTRLVVATLYTQNRHPVTATNIKSIYNAVIAISFGR
jgi:DNA-binding MurR/RpiR family transcriptional regulator